MTADWQNLIALAIVLTALAFLGRSVYRMLFGGKSACGGCGTCASDGVKTTPLVTLDALGKAPTAEPSPPSQQS